MHLGMPSVTEMGFNESDPFKVHIWQNSSSMSKTQHLRTSWEVFIIDTRESVEHILRSKCNSKENFNFSDGFPNQGWVPAAANQIWREGESRQWSQLWAEVPSSTTAELPTAVLHHSRGAPPPQIPYDSNARSQQAKSTLPDQVEKYARRRHRNREERRGSSAGQKYDYNNTAEPHFDDSIQCG